MPPSRNNTVKFSDLAAISAVGISDLVPVVDTSVPTLVNKKINVQDFSRSLPVSLQVTQLGTNSASWNSSYSTTQANSASWSTGGSYGSVYSSNSAEYESTFTSVNANSANWNSVYSLVGTASGGFTTLQANSSTWNTGYVLASSAYTSLNNLSSGTWVLKTGDQLTGALTTTKTLTTQFIDLDEFVSKRYVDAVSTISGNFVPSLYYTKNETDIGFVNRTNALINPTWNNASTVFTALSVNVNRVAADPNSSYANFILNGSSIARIGGTGTGNAFLNLGEDRGIITTNGNSLMIKAGTGGGYNYFFSPIGYILLGNPGGGTPAIAFSTQDAANNLPDTYLTADDSNNLAIRNALQPQSLRVYRGFVNTSTNFERFGLSGNRLAYELSGSQRFYIGSTTNNGIIGWANNIGGFNTLDVYNSQDFQFTKSGGATHILRCLPTGNFYEMQGSNPGGLQWDNGSGVVAGLYFDGFNTVAARNGINSQTFRVYNTYTNATNYERLALSANRIAYEYAGTGVSRDLTIVSTGNLVLSAGNAIQLSQALPFNFVSGLSTGNAVVAYASEAFQIRTGFIGGSNYFIKDQYSHGLYSDSGGLSIRAQGSYATIGVQQATPNPIFYFEYSGTSYLATNNLGKLGIFKGARNIYNPSATPAVSAHVSIVTDNSMNSYTSDMLLLSAGPNTSISNYINCVSAGQTIFSVNSTGSVFYNNIGATTFDSFGVVRFPADGTIIQTDGTGGRSGWNNVSVNNYAANNGNAPLASAKGQWNFPSVVNAPTAFTLNNSMYLLNDTATTQLLGVSSNRATSGLFFYQKSNGGAGAGGGSYIITVDNDDIVTHLFGGGNGKTFKIDSTSQGTCLSIRAPSNGHAFTGQVSFSPYNTTQNNIRLLQAAGQTGTFMQAVSSDSITTVFSITSAGITNINNKTFLRPDGLIQFTNTSSTTPAIKGTTNTIQARTGDDSQYTYLQGKLQTDQAANAGTFTPDKYIILYDSTGTAYKVPVQAL